MSFEKTSTLQNVPIVDIINGCSKCDCKCGTCNNHDNPSSSNDNGGSTTANGNYGASINS